MKQADYFIIIISLFLFELFLLGLSFAFCGIIIIIIKYQFNREFYMKSQQINKEIKQRKEAAKIAFIQMKTNLSKNENMVNQLRRMEYKEFLQSSYWKILKEYTITNIENKCSLCNSANECLLQLHHRTYEHKGEEYKNIRKSLTVLCGKCHSLFHANNPLFLKK